MNRESLRRGIPGSRGLDDARSSLSESLRGGAVTPYLLTAVERATEGRTLAANVALLEANAALAGEIATAYAVASASARAGMHGQKA